MKFSLGSLESLFAGRFQPQTLHEELMQAAFQAKQLSDEADVAGTVRATLLINFGPDGRVEHCRMNIGQNMRTIDMLTHVLGELVKRIDDPVTGDEELKSAAEIDRLASALHATNAHPDYIYVVCTRDRMSAMEAGGYEENLHWSGHPGDVSMRRKKL
jgi:hypothetical protein